jgi:manganese oxidase
MRRLAGYSLWRALSRTWVVGIPAVPGLLWLDSTAGTRDARRTSRGEIAEQIRINDNRTSAGVLRNGVLTIRLDARTGEWRPDGDAGPRIVVRVFGEEGKPLQIPAPLIRVPRGTEIRAFVRNSLSDSTLIVHGLYTRGAGGQDTVHVGPGQVREVRFKAGNPGTYYYWATTSAPAVGTRGIDSQLAGAFVVDSGTALGTTRDRVIVLGLWSSGAVPGVITPTSVVRFVMNGRTWPNTERLTYTVGDSVRFRIVNVSSAPHPMHLHGFYFTVDSRGDERSDSSYATSSPRHAVTERAAPGRTFSLTWVPERPGNWLFHCHDNLHVLRNRPLDGSRLPPEHHLTDVKNHSLEMMGGLVMGIEVRPNGVAATPNDDGRRRKLRLVAHVDSGGTDAEPAYGYTLHDGPTTTPTRAPLLPGPTIVLTRGEPVGITVVNELQEATAVHWHGIELDSYFDGVAGFSGAGKRISPVIAPRDSFEARFTPPRAGTFMYHPHADEVRQQQAGLTGAIIVLPPGERYDPERDVVLLVSTPRRAADGGTVFLNGTNAPIGREMRVGDRYRMRLINIHTFRPSMIARLSRDSTLLSWRAIAKDGMDLPADQATVRPAIQQSGNGEAYDFEFTPTSPGDIRFTMSSAAGVVLVTMPIRVRE